MKRHHRLVFAGAVAAAVLPGTLILATPAAVAEPRPNTADDLSLSGTKLHLEYIERQVTQASPKTKAEIEGGGTVAGATQRAAR